MALASWFQPSHRTLAAFLGLMLILGGTLGWLGWRLLAQEGALEKQRVQERLEQAADRIASALQRGLSDLEGYLDFAPGPGAKEPPADIAVLIKNEERLTVFPPGRLLFYPHVPRNDEPQAALFTEGEVLEFQRNAPDKAAEVFRELARRSTVPEVRAGALLRLGRNLRKAGRNEEALQAYGDLSRFGSVLVAGLPAELWAHEARGSVLEGMRKHEDLQSEAAAMWAALQSGRWRLSRPAWEWQDRADYHLDGNAYVRFAAGTERLRDGGGKGISIRDWIWFVIAGRTFIGLCLIGKNCRRKHEAQYMDLFLTGGNREKCSDGLETRSLYRLVRR